jgi:hypothetical protein
MTYLARWVLVSSSPLTLPVKVQRLDQASTVGESREKQLSIRESRMRHTFGAKRKTLDQAAIQRSGDRKKPTDNYHGFASEIDVEVHP